MIRRIRTFGF